MSHGIRFTVLLSLLLGSNFSAAQTKKSAPTQKEKVARAYATLVSLPGDNEGTCDNDFADFEIFQDQIDKFKTDRIAPVLFELAKDQCALSQALTEVPVPPAPLTPNDDDAAKQRYKNLKQKYDTEEKQYESSKEYKSSQKDLLRLRTKVMSDIKSTIIQDWVKSSHLENKLAAIQKTVSSYASYEVSGGVSITYELITTELTLYGSRIRYKISND